MQRRTYHVKTALEQKGARKKTFLAFKDSLGNPLSRSPSVTPNHWIISSKTEDLFHRIDVRVKIGFR